MATKDKNHPEITQDGAQKIRDLENERHQAIMKIFKNLSGRITDLEGVVFKLIERVNEMESPGQTSQEPGGKL